MPGLPMCSRKEGTAKDCATRKVFSDEEHVLLCPICILQHIGKGEIPVHYAAQGGRGEVIILCNHEATAPLSDRPALERGGTVFKSKCHQLYTFAEGAVTCPLCLEKVSS